jgi:hypothetical protein
MTLSFRISYSPSSKQLVATLPTPIHENLLKPLRDAIDGALASLDIEGLGNFIVQMNSTLRGLGEAGSTEKSLGTPDALLEFHDEDGGRVQLWGTEVTFSQTRDAAIAKLQRSVTLNPHMRAVTLFDILENHRHSPPTESSDAFRKLSKKKKVVSYHKWLQKDDSPVFGPVTGFTHTWVSSLTVVVSTWLRPDDGPFDLYDHNPRYFATAVSFPPSSGVAVSDHNDSDCVPTQTSQASKTCSTYSIAHLRVSGMPPSATWKKSWRKRSPVFRPTTLTLKMSPALKINRTLQRYPQRRPMTG